MEKELSKLYDEAGVSGNEFNSLPPEQQIAVETIIESIALARELMNKIDPGAEQDGESLSNLRKELIQESDRGLCLLSIGRLDNILTKMLETKLLGSKTFKHDLFNNNGPLGTLSSRIKLSYSLGLITKNTFEEIEVMRKVRNKFAHSDLPINFDSEEIEKICMGMRMFANQKDRKNRAKFITSFLFITSCILAELRQIKPFEVKKEYLTAEAIKKTAQGHEKIVSAFKASNPQ